MDISHSKLPNADSVIEALENLVEPNFQIDLESAEGVAYTNALFARLKALTRDATSTVRDYKQRTGEARASMDESLLHLQNLLYEKRHLEREIEKCREFGSIYQDVPLHSLEEFLDLAPLEARSQSVIEDEHQLLLNRLSFELEERQRLDRMRVELTKERDDLLAEVAKRQAKEEGWDRKTESLAKMLVELRRSLE